MTLFGLKKAPWANAGTRHPLWWKIGAFLFALGGLATLVLAVRFVVRPASASGPSSNRVLNYQIRLTDPSGIPTADGTKNIKIGFYDAVTGGTMLHTDCGTTGTPIGRKVVFAGGVGTVLIGDTAADASHNCTNGSAPIALPATLFNNVGLFLGITVEADAEMTPRKRIVATGYSLNADKLDDLDTSAVGGTVAFVPVTDASGNLTLTKDLTVDGTTLYVDSTNDRIGIRTAAPSTTFEAQGVNSTAVLGADIVTNGTFSADVTSWTAGATWSWSDDDSLCPTAGVNGCAYHAAGDNNLSQTLSGIVAGSAYQVIYSVRTLTTGKVHPVLGGAANGALYVGDTVGTISNFQVVLAPFSGGSVDLVFDPDATWSGSIDLVSVKPITPSSSVINVGNSDGTRNVEIRAGGSTKDNTLIGRNAGWSLTTGFNNTAIGVDSLFGTTTGGGNVAIGYLSMQSNTTGGSNVALGVSSLGKNTTGLRNVALGDSALLDNRSGSDNASTGRWSMLFNASGSQNAAHGARALFSNTTGSDNTGMGYNAGNANVSGSFNTFLGSNANSTTGVLTNATAIGANATVSASNSLVLGSGANVGIGTTAPGEKLEVVGNIISTGTAWTIRASAADLTWSSVTYGNGLFVAVAQSGTGNRVMTSTDGVNWTARTTPADNNWQAVTYGNGLFVAVASSGTGNRVMTSPDGITWTIRTSSVDNQWHAVTYGNGLFVAVSAFSGTGDRVMTSPDGITWTTRTTPADNFWKSVIYGNGLFVAVAASGTGNRVMTSPDGITWTLRTSSVDNQWSSVTYGNGLFVAVAESGTGDRVMTSPDGITWTTRTSAADNQWYDVTYGNGLFVAVAAVGGAGNRVMTSPDGITWTIRTSAADNQWSSVTYGNGLFAAVSYNGTGNRVMTSGKTATIPFSANNTYQGGMNVFGNVGVGTATPITQLHVPGKVPSAAAGSVATGDGPISVAVKGRYAYVLNTLAATLQVFDVSNSSAPVTIGSVATGADPVGVVVEGRYAYVTNFTANTLQVFDISNPAAPVSVGSVATGTGPSYLYVQGRYAYTANYTANTLQVFDISNPAATVSVGSVATGTSPQFVVVQGRYAYVTNNGSNTLQVFDISNPAAPVSVGSVATGTQPSGIYVQGRYAYVVNYGSNTLQIFTIANPAAPASVGSVATGTNPYSVFVQGRYAYVNNYIGNTLQAIDVSNPAAPVSVGSVATGSSPYGIFVQGRYAYIVNLASDSLQVFDLGGTYIQQVEAGGLESGTLTVRNGLQAMDAVLSGGLSVGDSVQVSGPLSVSGASAFIGNVGIGTTTPAGKLDIQAGTITTDTAFGLNVGGTLDASASGGLTLKPVKFEFSTSGAGTNRPEGMRVTLNAGYTGSGFTKTLFVQNVTASTDPFNSGTFSGNIGALITSTGSGVDNVGVYSQVSGATSRNLGYYARVSTATAGSNVGYFGIAANATTNNIGGYFALTGTSSGSLNTSAALIADNGTTVSPIFLARDNGTAVLTVADGGTTTLAGHFLPDVDDTFDLGSDTRRWRDLYLGPATLHIGTSTSDEGTISYNTTTNALQIDASSGGTVEIAGGSGSSGCTVDASGNFTCSGAVTGGSGGPGWTDDGTVVRLTTVTDNVGIGTTSPASKLAIQGSTSSGSLGSDIVTNGTFSADTNWTKGANWTIAAGVATHTAGDNNLSQTLALTAGQSYQVIFTANTTTVGSLAVQLGNASSYSIGQTTGAVVNQVVLTPASGTDIIFDPDAAWAGTIDNVTVKLITKADVLFTLHNSDATVGSEFRSGGSSADNTLAGKNAGQHIITAGNITAFGSDALHSATTGNSNTGIGTWALYSNTTGDTNTAVGTFAMEKNTVGSRNTAMGHLALTNNNIGTDNVAIGRFSLLANTSGIQNTAVGTNAGDGNTTGSNNLFLGYGSDVSAGTFTKAAAIGYNAIVGCSSCLALGGTGADVVMVGIGTTTPVARFNVVGESVLFTGTFGTGVAPVSGAGERMLWYPGKAAIRAGRVTASQWNDANIGNHSAAFNLDTQATSHASFATGNGSTASGDVSTAMGASTVASGIRAVAIGESATASGTQSMALGTFVTAGSSSNTFVLGRGVDSSNRLVNTIRGSLMYGHNDTTPTLYVRGGEPYDPQGTVSNSAGGTAVTGSITFFTNDIVPGDRITIGGETRIVSVVTNDSSITVATPFTNAHSGSTFTVSPALLKLQDSSAVGQFVVDAAGNVGVGTVTPASFKLQVAGDAGPNADNTFDLGSSALRWKTLHTGPGSVVVHNDATNTNKITLGYTGSTATLTSTSGTPFEIRSGTTPAISVSGAGAVTFNGNLSSSQPLTIAAVGHAQGGSTRAIWRLDESSGTATAAEVTGTYPLATITGTPGVTTGQFGNARTFGGAADVRGAADAGSVTQMKTGAWTLGMWFIANNTSAGNMFALMDAGLNAPFHVKIAAGGGVCAGSTDQGNNCAGTVTPGVWTFLTIVHTGAGAGFDVYLNGALAGHITVNDSGLTPASPLFVIGNGPHQFFSGTIDDVFLENTAMSSGAISAEYAAATQAMLTVTGKTVLNGNVGIGTATPTSFKLQVAGDVGPNVDNTYDLGSSALRWKTLHVGPGSVVVHNDTTNTNKMTLGFTSSTAQLSTNAGIALEVKSGTATALRIDSSGAASLNSAFSILRPATFSANGHLQAAETRGLWRLDESSGTVTAADVTGTYPLATIGGTPGVAAGKFGNARTFNGSSYVRGAADAASVTQIKTGAWSLGMWFVSTNSATGLGKNLFALMDASNNAPFHVKVAFNSIYAGSTDQGNSNIGGTITDGLWYHMVLTHAAGGSGFDLYLDGAFIGHINVNNSALTPASPLFVIGSGPHDEFEGTIDDVFLENRVMTASEILAEFNLASSTTPLTVNGTSYFNGNVGLGDTSPNATLDVEGLGGDDLWRTYFGPDRSLFNPLLQGYTDISTNVVGSLNSASTGRGAGLQVVNQDNSTSEMFGVYGAIDSTHSSGMRQAAVALNGEVFHSGAGNVNILSGLATYAAHNSSGTTTAMTGLRVYGNFRSTGTVTNNYGIYVEGQSGVGTNNYQIYSQTAAGTEFTVRSDGNVGIGTIDPVTRLDVRGTAGSGLLTSFGPLKSLFTAETQGYLDTGINIASSLNSGGTGRFTALMGVNEDNDTSSGDVIGVYGFAISNNASGTKNFVQGVEADAEKFGNGNVSQLMGIRTAAGIPTGAGTGVVANAVGIRVASNYDTGGGSITNNYGIYVEGQAGVGTTGNYQIFSEGTTGAFVVMPDGSVGIGGDITPDFALDVEAPNATVASFSRGGSDGTIISLQRDGVEQGSISVSGTTISYNAFTGSHYAWSDEQIAQGMLVRYTGNNHRLHGDEGSEMLYGITPTVEKNDPMVLGVYLALKDPNEAAGDENPHLVMAVGNGDLWVVDEGEGIAAGDYLMTSDTSGHAMKDAGTESVSHLIARAAESIDWSAVTETVGGKKHKKISVTFVNFTRYSQAQTTELTVAETLDYKGYGIENVLFLRGLNGNWSIDEAGLLTSKAVVTEKVTTQNLTIKNEGESVTAGTGVIRAGAVGELVINPLVNGRSIIVVTFEGDTGARWWISEKENGKFMVNLSSPALAETKFSYWIVGLEGDASTAEPPVATPAESPVEPPAPAPEEAAPSEETPPQEESPEPPPTESEPEIPQE